MEEIYTTKDIGEVATLLTKGFDLLNMYWRGETAFFDFANKSEAEKIAHQYNFGGVEVSAKAFYDNLITVKRKILNHQDRRRKEGRYVRSSR